MPAERKHRHIMENGLTLLAHASMRFEYWDIAFRTSVFLINRLPTSTLHGQNPFETLFGQKPEYTSLKVFGCSCFPNTKHFNNHKLQFKPVECTFLGYSINHKGYKCLDPNGKIIIFRDVISDEFSFPFAKNKTNGAQSSSIIWALVLSNQDWPSHMLLQRTQFLSSVKFILILLIHQKILL